jgi:hypothetical protein
MCSWFIRKMKKEKYVTVQRGRLLLLILLLIFTFFGFLICPGPFSAGTFIPRRCLHMPQERAERGG